MILFNRLLLKHPAGTQLRTVHSCFILSRIMVLVVVVSAGLSHSGFASDEKSGNIILEGSPERGEVRIGELLPFTLRLTWQGEPGRYRIVGTTDPELDGFELENCSVEHRNFMQEGQRISEHLSQYLFSPAAEGRGRIGKISVLYTMPPDTTTYYLSTAAYAVTILPPAQSLFTRTRIALLMVIPLLGALVLFLLMRRRKKGALAGWGKASREGEGDIPLLSTAEEALQRIDGLSTLKISGEIKKLYGEVPRILKEYITERKSLSFTGLSWLDFSTAIAPLDIDRREKEVLQTIIEECEKVKFADALPSPEGMDIFLQKVRRWLEQFESALVDQ